MAKGLIGGMTDYSHQSFEDVKHDIKDEQRRTKEFVDEIENNIGILENNGYWKKVPSEVKSIVAYALRHYHTSITEFGEIAKEIESHVADHHIKRLKKIAQVALKINRDIGRSWHQDYLSKEYGNSDFLLVERVYGDTRDMSVNLLDVYNMAGRLEDFVGKEKKTMKNNPWSSGLFYLFVAVVVIAGLAVLTNYISWYILSIILIGGILLVGIIGALQLKNDNQITDASFVKLMIETYKRLPLLRKK